MRRVCFEFAQRLSGLSAHSTAGDFYTLADNIDLAIDSYTSSGDWCKALDIAKRVKKDKEYIDNLARVFDEMLCLREKFSDAAKLCIEYLMDYELAALRYAYAGEWDEAFRMSRFSEESEPVVDKLRIMLGEDCASVIKQIDTFSDEIQQKLDKVHETNSQIGLPTARKEFQGFGGHDINDTSSECSLSSLESSLGSRTSFYTDNTSSSR